MYSILIIEDDIDIAFLIKTQLEIAGYNAFTCSDGLKAEELLLKNTLFDLFIVDRMLPGKNGLDLCRLIRQTPNLKDKPILLLTALDQNDDVIQGLDAGADDYITKPFEMNILLARVRALLRRNKNSTDNIKFNNMVINVFKCELKIDQEKIHLTATEWQILVTLATKPGHVFTREELIQKIQGPQVHVTERTMDTHIAGLRKKLKDYSTIIETIRGIGYRFADLP